MAAAFAIEINEMPALPCEGSPDPDKSVLSFSLMGKDRQDVPYGDQGERLDEGNLWSQKFSMDFPHLGEGEFGFWDEFQNGILIRSEILGGVARTVRTFAPACFQALSGK